MKHKLQAETLSEEVVRLRARVLELEATVQILRDEVEFWKKATLLEVSK